MKKQNSIENLVTQSLYADTRIGEPPQITSAALSSGSLLFSLAASASYTSYS